MEQAVSGAPQLECLEGQTLQKKKMFPLCLQKSRACTLDLLSPRSQGCVFFLNKKTYHNPMNYAVAYIVFVCCWRNFVCSVACIENIYPARALCARDGCHNYYHRKMHWQIQPYSVCGWHITLLNYSIKCDNESSLTSLNTQVNKEFTLKYTIIWSQLWVNKQYFSLQGTGFGEGNCLCLQKKREECLWGCICCHQLRIYQVLIRFSLFTKL